MESLIEYVANLERYVIESKALIDQETETIRKKQTNADRRMEEANVHTNALRSIHEHKLRYKKLSERIKFTFELKRDKTITIRVPRDR
jgi:hypothetical protein